jgi:hypothetical protein
MSSAAHDGGARPAADGGGAPSAWQGELMAVLAAGLSADGDVRNPAEAMLEQWRELPGYYSLLKEVVVRGDAPLEVRGASVVLSGAPDPTAMSPSLALTRI